MVTNFALEAEYGPNTIVYDNSNLVTSYFRNRRQI